MKINFTELACYTIETIQRENESVEETINRILETLAATAPDFDHFFGEPRDGKGPSGGTSEDDGPDPADMYGQ
jgi:hypothetical protein